MSKSNNHVIILPGESGWEIWSRSANGAFELQHATDLMHVGDLENIPNGDLTLLFALRSVTTVPMRVMTADEAMFEDLVALHAERLGLRADPLAGQLNDLFEIRRENDSAVLLSIWLKKPGEGDLPRVGPKAFDLSARAISVQGSAVTVWRELGRWVFAVHQDDKLLYAQATACESEQPDAALARELKFSLMQLSMQGLHPTPSRLDVLSADASLDLGALRDGFELPVAIRPRPAPVLPAPVSKLLPEDVRAARKEAQRKQRIQLGVGAAALLYLLLLGWLAYGLWQKSRRVADLEQQAELAAPAAEAYTLHMERWHELADAIDIDHAPVEILYRIHSCIPKNAGVRLTTAEVGPYEVNLRGEAPSSEAANQFKLNLRKNTSLSRYDWDLPDSTPGKRGRDFQYRGNAAAPHQAP